jgi:hypothetical protein
MLHRHLLHSMLRLHNDPRLPPSLLLERRIHQCRMAFRSIISRLTLANARIRQNIQTTHSSGTMHSRGSSIQARPWLQERSVPFLQSDVHMSLDQNQRATNIGCQWQGSPTLPAGEMPAAAADAATGGGGHGGCGDGCRCGAESQWSGRRAGGGLRCQHRPLARPRARTAAAAAAGSLGRQRRQPDRPLASGRRCGVGGRVAAAQLQAAAAAASAGAGGHSGCGYVCRC